MLGYRSIVITDSKNTRVECYYVKLSCYENFLIFLDYATSIKTSRHY